MLFLGYPKCSTSNKAKKWLNDNDVVFINRDIKENNPTKSELLSWHSKSKLEIKKFFNTSGKLYREQGIKDLIKTATLDELIDILSLNGMMVKRPMLISEHFVLVGFKENEWQEAVTATEYKE